MLIICLGFYIIFSLTSKVVQLNYLNVFFYFSFLCVCFMCRPILFKILCYLCSYVVLFSLRSIGLLTRYVNKQELN